MILVTGMHRSGTSAAAHLLIRMGMDAGDPAQMLAADPWNARGYWENKRMLICNDRLMLGGGRFYPPSYYLRARGERTLSMKTALSLLWMRFLLRPAASAAAIRRRAGPMGTEMRALAAEFQGRLVKDPRFALTLSCWKALNAVERVLVMIRRPEECARSMARRNRLPIRCGLDLWKRHVRTLLDELEGIPVVFADFNRLLDPRHSRDELDRLIAFSGLSVKDTSKAALLNDVIRPDLASAGGETDAPPDAETAALCRRLQRARKLYGRPRPFRAEPSGKSISIFGASPAC